MLINRVEGILEDGGFDYCSSEGCFDIAAHRDFTLFLKVLENVDSIKAEHAKNLKILSETFGASVALIGLHTRRENLRDNIVYERFDIPAFTPATLESIVVNEVMPLLYRFKGGLFADVNPEKLRTKREKAGFTQKELAEQVGITKKNVYEHERVKKKALYDHVKIIEKLIGNITDSANIRTSFREESNIPKDGFEKIVFRDFKKMGFSSGLVYKSPFNIVVKNREIMILSKADENKRRIEKDVPHIISISDVIDVPAIAVTREDMELDIPSIQEKDLREMRSVREIRKMLK